MTCMIHSIARHDTSRLYRTMLISDVVIVETNSLNNFRAEFELSIVMLTAPDGIVADLTFDSVWQYRV